MTAADWGILVPAAAAFLTAAAAWLKSRATAKTLSDHLAREFQARSHPAAPPGRPGTPGQRGW